ncbi:MAG: hypothetical protein HC786_23235 [Richelia sp. CSU_2_1]|nr:hypothetical protein [Richelia sp. CSU_2_1]
MDPNISVEAAGASLSQKNASQIKQAWIALTELLVASGNLSFSDLPKELITPQSLYDSQRSEIEAAELQECVDRDAWHSKLNILLDRFRYLFSVATERGADSPEAAVSDLLSEFSKIALRMAREVPDKNYPHLQMSESGGDEEELRASDASIFLHIEARAAFDPSATNEKIVEGILFQVDRPSEAIPNVGPGLPLLIPREVALEALSCLSFDRPKPLDAHDTFSQHASTEIVGAMTGARIDGDDFWVTGVLWDYNQPEKVESISSSQDSLGMSVNAAAEGRPAEIDGRMVWQVDRLRILGANILLSEKATFKKTKTSVLASGADLGIEIPLAASGEQTDNQSNTGEQSMDLSVILSQIEKLNASVSKMHDETQSRLAVLEPVVQSLTLQMNAIQAEAKDKEERDLQAAAQQAKQEEESRLVAAMTSAFEKQLAASAPQGSLRYPKRTLPLAASGAPPATANSIQLELAEITGELRALEQNPHAENSRLFELQDRKLFLQGQLASRNLSE